MGTEISAVIVQARFGSTRLPGKVLEEVAGHSVLSHVLTRCARIPGISAVVCAVPVGEINDGVAAEASRTNAVVFRGSELDVLNRYIQAAREIDARFIVRVTSDNALIDPDICGDVLAMCRYDNLDYACNNMPRTWPHGLDCEAFTREALERSAVDANLPFEREHVTPRLRTSKDYRKRNLPCGLGGLGEYRWTVDHPEDLRFLRELSRRSSRELEMLNYKEILEVLHANPDLRAINAKRIEMPV